MSSDAASSNRVLVHAPVGRDATLICEQLGKGGILCELCDDMPAVCACLAAGAGAIVFTEEALTPHASATLAEVLHQQPPWSEIPVLVLTGLPSMEGHTRSFRAIERRTSITLLDRPVRIKSLISAAQSALSARARQYEVRDLMEKLEDRVHERDRFLAILGHELRNPLGAILLASQMVESDGLLDGEHARLIERQSRHLTRIVNDLLDLSRVVSGKIVIKPEVVDLAQSARQALQTLHEAVRRQEVEVELRLPPHPVHVAADPVRADQIITNVLSNAIKYTPNGGHVLLALETEGREAVMTVSDDGVGIAPERIDTIFELFAQAENAIGRAQGGMGIGLALVRNLVQLQGGSVRAKSDGIGKGTAFEIRLPLAAESLADAGERPSGTEQDATPGRRIVIVEDNPDVRELLKLRLKRLGHSVEAVADGLSGVETIVRSRPDLALIDIGLPHLDGYEVASRVRSELGSDILLIAVSGFGLPEDKRKAADAGFDDHITKPADVTDIENILRRTPRRSAGAA